MPRHSVENRKMNGSRVATAVVFALFALLSASSAARAQEISSLSQLLGTTNSSYNAYVLGNVGSSTSAYTSDSAGAIAAGGNVYLNSFSADGSGSSSSTAIVTGGNLTLSNGSITGSAYVGGNATLSGASVSGSVQAQGTISTSNMSTPTEVSGSSAATPINFTALATDTKNEAISIASLATQAQSAGTAGSVSGTNNLTLTGTASGVNYFNLTAAQLSQLSSGSLTIDNTVAGATDIINVTGSSVTVGAPGNFGFTYQGTASASNTLFDFSQATSLTIANAFDASILAPTATVNFTNGNLTGVLVAGNPPSPANPAGAVLAGTCRGPRPRRGGAPAPATPFGSSPLVGLILAAVMALGFYRRRTPAAVAA